MFGNEHKCEFQGPIGKIEAQISEGDGQKQLGIIVCHPHPQYGGTMAHSVVRAIYKFFANQGYPTLRFNFRGIGKSEGKFAEGVGEKEDTLAACDFLMQSGKNVQKILLAGYSFGATIVGSIADRLPQIVGYIAISYPFTLIPQFVKEARSMKPKLFVIGDQDDFTSLEDFNKGVFSIPEPKSIKIMAHMDHFWNGYEDKLIKEIENWFKNQKW